MKMTERYGSSGGGSNRKHKKHKTSTNISASTPTKLLNNNGNSFDDNSLTTESSFTTNGQQQSSSTDNATKSLKLVLKVGQSGSYSPATSTTSASFLNNNIEYTDYNTDSIISGDSSNNDRLPKQSSPPPPPPPELLPLTVDSYHHNVDFTQINNTLKKSKKKKKKHHHHHHHGHGHHHSKSLTSNDNVPSTTATNMTRNFVEIEGQNLNKKNNSIDHIVNNLSSTSSASNNNEIVLNMKNSNCKRPNSIIMVLDNQSIQPNHSIEESSKATNMVKDDSQYSLNDKQTCLSINEPTVSSNNIHNSNNDNELIEIDDDDEEEDDGEEVEDAIMGSMLFKQDSIFSSVDLLDIDSCSKLDISALVPEDDELNDDVSQQSATSSLMSQYQLNQRPRAKLRPTSSIYRQMLQKGQVLCDSNNLYEHLRRKEKMSTSKTSGSREKPSMFQKFLISLVERLQSKDVHKLFAWPVIDSLTPGYSQVICHPMDFHTIHKKIEHNLYRSVAELKFDVRLLCENAIRYYRHSGLHYKEASRLWYFAKTRVFARDQLAEHVKQFPPLTMIDLGMDDLSKLNSSTADKIETTANGVEETSHPTTLHSLLNDTKCEPNLVATENSIDQEPTAEQILEDTKKSLRLSTADSSVDVPEFTLTAPRNDAVIFTRLRPDGTTTLPFVVSDENQTDEGIILRHLTGSLTEGSSALPPTVEPVSQRIKPCHYIEESLINPFSSHLPYIDSGSSTIDHHDTALLFETFEKYQPSKHSDEIERVANDQSYLMKSFVDSLLVTVSNGDYKPDEKEVQLCNGQKHDEIDDPAETETDLDTNPIQESLNQTKDLLERLNRVQSQRLTRTNEPIEPTNNEKEIAGKVTNSLVDIIKCWFKPADVIDQKTVHKQLGIVFKTEQSPDSDCPEQQFDKDDENL